MMENSLSLNSIKLLKGEFVVDEDEVESTRPETAMSLAISAEEQQPFLLGLHSHFQKEPRIHSVAEDVSGSNSILHIQRKQFAFPQIKYYAAEVLLALEYLHAKGLIFCDLKLVTLDGRVRFIDRGLGQYKELEGMNTLGYAPEFMAPELLLEQRYGPAADWWAFGVLVYQMFLGRTPFQGDDDDEVFDAILEDEPLYPTIMPPDAVSIVQKLLTRDPKRRLGKEGAEELKLHPFFKDVNFDGVLTKRIPLIYSATSNGISDKSNAEESTGEQSNPILMLK